MYEIFLKIAEIVEVLGYFGLFIMTMIESTFIPIPSEITLIPAGFLISEGKMNFAIVSIFTVLGTICGALLNYAIAYKFGRKLMLKYGKYLFIDDSKLKSMEIFFKKHGEISMFTGRLLPGIKHFISFPAGLAKMDLKPFFIYTALGGAIWNNLLIALGYLLGESDHLIKPYLKQLNIALIAILSVLVIVYVIKHKNKKKLNK